MKFLSIILNIYVLLLSAIPCHCNGHEALLDNADVHSAISMQCNDNNTDNHTDTDTCSPFCASSCSCHSVNIIMLSFSFIEPMIYSITTNSHYIEDSGLSVPHDFWRPPII
ncbi:MAG: hypothetical protein LBJ17_09495 [Dysgonamonadaceae bacterium]|nr:hypothetical protein [Dysgonamonadaceae bacterium]